jgi:lipoate-protein ligase A
MSLNSAPGGCSAFGLELAAPPRYDLAYRDDKISGGARLVTMARRAVDRCHVNCSR